MARWIGFSLFLSVSLNGCKGGTNLVSLPHQIDTFTQSPSQQRSLAFQQRPGVIDILFAVSNAPSMCVKAAKISAAFSDFLSQIEAAGLDYHIGVVTTDLSNPATAGQLVSDGQGHAFLTTTTGNAAGVFAAIVAAVGSTGTPDSQPLLAAATALQQPLSSGANRGFLRGGASLAVIVVDDKDDFSLVLPPKADGGVPVGGTTLGDPIGLYFARLFKGLKGPGNDALVSVSAIAGAEPGAAVDAGLPPPVDCAAAQANINSSCVFLDNTAYAGQRLFGVVQQTAGLGQSICESSFGGILKNLGQLLVGLTRNFAIAAAGQTLQFSPSSLSVTVSAPGGSPQVISQDPNSGYTYAAATQAIEFNGNYVPAAGSTVTVGYRQLQSSFTLTYTPVAGTLTVTVNQAAVPSDATDPVNGYHLDPGSTLMTFPLAHLPPPGATIVAAYNHQ